MEARSSAKTIDGLLPTERFRARSRREMPETAMPKDSQRRMSEIDLIRTVRDHDRHCERKRSNPSGGRKESWIASSLPLLAMTANIVRVPAARMRPSCAKNLPPRKRGRAGMPGAQCTRSLVCEVVVKMHTSIHSGRTGNHPASPHAMVLTASFGLSPAIGLFCHRRLQRLNCKLDASVEASGPHDFSVRLGAVRQKRRRVHRIRSQRS